MELNALYKVYLLNCVVIFNFYAQLAHLVEQ